MPTDAQLREARARHKTRHNEPNQGDMTEVWSEAELELGRVIDQYKRVNQRPFPDWSEVLEVLKLLGYRKAKVSPAQQAAERAANDVYRRRLERKQQLRRRQRGK